MKINCIIIDDEPLAIKVIENHIKEIPNISIVATFSNPIDAILTLGENKIDVIFLDINMSRMTGLEFLKNTNVKPFVILTTAYSEYAVEGYELNVLDYLVKPIPFYRFLKAIHKLTHQISLRDSKDITTSPKENNYLFLKVDKKMVKIFLDNICHIEGLKDFIQIYTLNEHFVTYKSLSGIMSELPCANFIRVHKSYIVAINKVKSIEGNMIETVTKKRIPIGRSYATHAKEILLKED